MLSLFLFLAGPHSALGSFPETVEHYYYHTSKLWRHRRGQARDCTRFIMLLSAGR